ncbi:MAG TPA: hemolysin family protein [Longimicrobiales bacterium]
MDPASTVLKLIAVLALIGLNGGLVAARSAFIGVRRSRLEPLARGGTKRAQRVLAELDAPERFLAGTRVGSTIATIGIGWIAETALHGLIVDRLGSIPAPVDTPVAAHAIATAAALLLVVWLHTTLGELVPRLIAGQEPERVVLRTFGSARLVGRVLQPLLGLSSWTAAAVLRLFGRGTTATSAQTHTPSEIRLLVEQAPEGTGSDQEQMLLGVFHLRDTLAREVMTPRRDIIALPVTATLAETLALVADEGHSRIPVYRESIDDITGVLLVKDLLTHITRAGADETAFDLARLAREPYFVPDTKRIGELLPELRTKSVHMAIVLDEFGGTDGLVTLEDMLEEIVGDIYDEHDIPEEETDFEITDSGEVLIDGGASIFDVNERFGLALPEQDYDTIGGYVFGELGRVPVAGDVVLLDGAAELRVDEVEERRVTRVRLVLKPKPVPDQPEHTAT